MNIFILTSLNQNISDVLKEINKNKKYNIIISSENFETLKFTKHFHNFIKEIKKTHELKIIWTIREQFSYLISLLSMLINKGAFINNFEILVNKILKEGSLNFKPYIFWFDYIKQYKKIREVFKIKKKDIFLLIYSKKNNIFNDFFEILSIKTKVNPSFYRKNVSKYFFDNKRNLKNIIKFLLNYNKKYFNKSLIESKKISADKIILKKNQILMHKAKILNSYKLRNEKLMKLFKKNKFDKINFYEY